MGRTLLHAKYSPVAPDERMLTYAESLGIRLRLQPNLRNTYFSVEDVPPRNLRFYIDDKQSSCQSRGARLPDASIRRILWDSAASSTES